MEILGGNVFSDESSSSLSLTSAFYYSSEESMIGRLEQRTATKIDLSNRSRSPSVKISLEDKKEQNKLAARKSRAKKKLEVDERERHLRTIETNNENMRETLEKLNEIKSKMEVYIKNLEAENAKNNNNNQQMMLLESNLFDKQVDSVTSNMSESIPIEFEPINTNVPSSDLFAPNNKDIKLSVEVEDQQTLLNSSFQNFYSLDSNQIVYLLNIHHQQQQIHSSAAAENIFDNSMNNNNFVISTNTSMEECNDACRVVLLNDSPLMVNQEEVKLSDKELYNLTLNSVLYNDAFMIQNVDGLETKNQQNEYFDSIPASSDSDDKYNNNNNNDSNLINKTLHELERNTSFNQMLMTIQLSQIEQSVDDANLVCSIPDSIFDNLINNELNKF